MHLLPFLRPLTLAPAIIAPLLFTVLSGMAAETPPPAITGPLIINEFSADAKNGVLDDDDEPADWLEILNQGSEAVSLAGWHVSDNASDPEKWALPEMTLAPGDFLLVYASGKDRRDPAQPLHASFKLNAGGEYLSLTKPDGSVSHAFDPDYPSQRSGFSYGMADDGSFLYFPSQTPGEANGDDGRCLVADTKFSIDRGFFDTPFEVEITCATPGVTIRYTTDGNAPFAGTLFGGAKGSVYEGPITIDQSTVLRAYATRPGWEPSNIDTQTYLFLDDIARQSPNGEVPDGWPEGSVNGQRFDFGMDPDVVDDPEYADQILPALRALPSMSLVMDHDDLTGSKDGIYVHAREDGRAWERPGSLELLHPDGEPGFQINAGFRIRGGFSRDGGNPKHSFRVFFRDEYGDGALRFPLFGEEGVEEFKKLDFRTAQNYAWSLNSSNDARRNTFLREIFARDSQRALGQPYTRSRYYHLYVNGQYWGLFMSQERAEADYAESYFGGDSDDYDVIKVEAGPYTIYATAGSIAAFDELHSLVAGELTDADFYALQGKNLQGEDDPNLTKHIDVDNLIDYMMIIFYVGSFDAPLAGTDRANNFYAVRNREARDGWRFFSHDTEHSMMNPGENRMGPYPAGRSAQHFNPQYLHQQLMQSDAYRLAFADAVWREFFHDGVFTVESARARWLARQEEIELAIIAESARWGDQHVSTPYTKADWLQETDWILNTFMPTRTETVFDQMKKVGLTGDLLLPEFRPDGGVIEDADNFTFKLSVGTLFNVQAGDIYYTLDGTDPRMPDGSVAPSATLYERNGPGVSLPTTATVRSRLLHEGRWSPLNEVTFVLGGALATAENLVISEIMYHPPAPEAGSAFPDENAFEFLEFWNPTDTAIDLTGAKFESGIDFIFPAFQLGPGQRAVIVHTRAAFEERYGNAVAVIGEYGGGTASKLDNGGEHLTLRNVKGDVIVSFSYGDGGDWPSAADGEGYSLVLADPKKDSTDSASWQASTLILGSPGTAPDAVPASTYAAWKQMHGVEDDAADPDQDGLSHFMEFATGHDDPLVPNLSHIIGIAQQEKETAVLEIIRRTSPEITTTIESSADLTNWRPAAGAQLIRTVPNSAFQERQEWQVTLDEDTAAFRARHQLESPTP